MEKTHWWIMGGLTLTGLGIGSYFLFFHKKEQTGAPKYGNQKLKNRKGNRSGNRDNTDGSIQISKNGQAKSISIPNWNNPYDMAYTQEVKAWLSPQRTYELNPKDAEKLATQLKEAYGGAWYANDDEEAVKTVFSKMLKDKIQVSGLSKAFWNKYQKDMWEYLNHFLSRTEMEEYVHQPVKALPNYRVVKKS